MIFPLRYATPCCLLLACSLTLAACGSTVVPSATRLIEAEPASPSASPTEDPAALGNYAAAMCPIFEAILALDPRVGAVRQAASEGGDLSLVAVEMAALGDELLVVLTDLEAVPDWKAGAALRHQLVTSLHGIRAVLLRVGRDPADRGAADLIDGMPFIATDGLDRAMNAATIAGLRCETGQ